MVEEAFIDIVTFDQFNAFLISELKYTSKLTSLAPRRYQLNSLKSYFKNLPYTRENFGSMIADLKIKGYKNNTVNRRICYGIALAKLVKASGFEKMTYFPEPRKKSRDCLTWDEMDRIATAPIEYKGIRGGKVNSEEINYKYYCLIRLLSETGCRIGEAIGLTWDNVDKTIITFPDTKNGETRSIVITPQLAAELQELPRYGKKVLNMNSTSLAGKEISRRAHASGVVKKNSISPHLFRHSVITNLVMGGAPIKVVMELVGHKRMETTAGYINTNLDDMENMLYSYSGMWESKLTAKLFLDKALKMVTKLLTKQAHRVTIGEDQKHYLIKIPKNAFFAS